MLLAFLTVGTFSFTLLLLYRESTTLPEGLAAPGDSLRRWGPVLSGAVAPIDLSALVRGLVAPVGLLVAATVVVASPLFFVLPRWNVANFEVSSEPLRTVGFSNTVLLGELGEVVNNPDLVMRIQFFRGIGTRPIKLEGEPLFRGTVVTQYRSRTWSHAFSKSPVMLPTEPKSTIVRQRISIEPLDVKELFCVYPVYSIGPPDARLRMDISSSQLMRLEEYRSQTLEVEVGTTGISGNRQRDLLPSRVKPNDYEMRGLTERPPLAQFPGLTRLAGDVLTELGIDPAQNRADAARALSRYFHASGAFFYSLEPQPRSEELDPLEDFVTIHRGGHCEYFAGALVLMLRSQGIPARMAIGFKGGEWNPLGDYYQVQQLHAHAWVEVYLAADQIPAGALDDEPAPRGAWLVLDPTEGIQQASAASLDTGIVARTRQMIDYARVLWINYVASLNSKRQRQGIYEPIAAGIDAGVEHLTSVEVWQARLRTFEESRAAKFWYWYRRHWFSWRGGLVAIGFSLFMVGMYFGLRSVARAMLRRGWLGQGSRDGPPPVLEMYRRLEAALGRLGLSRRPAQTAHEFALAAGGELAERMDYRRVAHLPRRIVESFYRVRFGGCALDNDESMAVEHALAELERATAQAASFGIHSAAAGARPSQPTTERD
jgi:transglutaminase-like putative cysteine protease